MIIITLKKLDHYSRHVAVTQDEKKNFKEIVFPLTHLRHWFTNTGDNDIPLYHAGVPCQAIGELIKGMNEISFQEHRSSWIIHSFIFQKVHESVHVLLSVWLGNCRWRIIIPRWRIIGIPFFHRNEMIITKNSPGIQGTFWKMLGTLINFFF